MQDSSIGILGATMASVPWAGGGLTLILAQADGPVAGPAPAEAQAPGVPGSGGGQSLGQPAGPAPGGGSPSGSLFGSPFILVPVMLLIIVMTSWMGSRKDKKRRAAMMASLKRHDRVQTLGGIIGTIVELRDDEVVLKVDEGTNTRIRFARSAVQQVLRESSAKDGAKDPGKDGAEVEGKPAEKLAV